MLVLRARRQVIVERNALTFNADDKKTSAWYNKLQSNAAGTFTGMVVKSYVSAVDEKGSYKLYSSTVPPMFSDEIIPRTWQRWTFIFRYHYGYQKKHQQSVLNL